MILLHTVRNVSKFLIQSFTWLMKTRQISPQMRVGHQQQHWTNTVIQVYKYYYAQPIFTKSYMSQHSLSWPVNWLNWGWFAKTCLNQNTLTSGLSNLYPLPQSIQNNAEKIVNKCPIVEVVSSSSQPPLAGCHPPLHSVNLFIGGHAIVGGKEGGETSREDKDKEQM